MSRGNRGILKKIVNKDYIYNSELLYSFINQIMKHGKKSVAEKIVYGALNFIKLKYDKNPLVVFERALEHIKPMVEVKSRRVGGATYQVPIEVRPERSMTLAMRWLVKYSRKRNENTMILKLANEILEASDINASIGKSKGKGASIKKREETHRMAEANKAFSHYRW